MSGFRFDFSDAQRATRRLGALESQIPFALALALNASAEIGRRTLIEDTWPDHVKARNANFLKSALTTKGERATKRRLRVVVYDKLGRAHLRAHETGGTKTPRGAALAVPSAELRARRTGKGVPKGMRPRNLPVGGPNGTFRKGDVLYQRTGSGQSRGLKLRYVFKRSVPIRASVPFHADFGRAVRRAMPTQFRLAMHRAMQTAIKR